MVVRKADHRKRLSLNSSPEALRASICIAALIKPVLDCCLFISKGNMMTRAKNWAFGLSPSSAVNMTCLWRVANSFDFMGLYIPFAFCHLGDIQPYQYSITFSFKIYPTHDITWQLWQLKILQKSPHLHVTYIYVCTSTCKQVASSKRAIIKSVQQSVKHGD